MDTEEKITHYLAKRIETHGLFLIPEKVEEQIINEIDSTDILIGLTEKLESINKNTLVI